jgi:hypothetical protein
MHQQRVNKLGNTANPFLNLTWKQHKKCISNFSFQCRKFGNFVLCAFENTDVPT